MIGQVWVGIAIGVVFVFLMGVNFGAYAIRRKSEPAIRDLRSANDMLVAALNLQSDAMEKLLALYRNTVRDRRRSVWRRR